jgi:hypothetical protein
MSSLTPQPILFVDVDGVLSVFGFPPLPAQPPGGFHSIDGIPHCIPGHGGPRLDRLAATFELVWATGWEEKANEYLPRILGLAGRDLPVLSFDGSIAPGGAHWKLAAIERYAGQRPAAWLDDNLDDRCERWAAQRVAPTLLVRTEPALGLTDEHVAELEHWAAGLAPAADY